MNIAVGFAAFSGFFCVSTILQSVVGRMDDDGESFELLGRLGGVFLVALIVVWVTVAIRRSGYQIDNGEITWRNSFILRSKRITHCASVQAVTFNTSNDRNYKVKWSEAGHGNRQRRDATLWTTDPNRHQKASLEFEKEAAIEALERQVGPLHPCRINFQHMSETSEAEILGVFVQSGLAPWAPDTLYPLVRTRETDA